METGINKKETTNVQTAAQLQINPEQAMKPYIKKLTQAENLTVQEAAKAMDLVLDGGATPAQIAAFLVALRMKGETIEEITGCATTMKQKASHIRPKVPGYRDCVGTGGDGTGTFNISTTAAFVIAGAGVPIAKHGNRAISSHSGSVDLLEALGVNVMMTPEQIQQCVEEIGIGFMFARIVHPCMKTVSQVRGEMGIRSIFNILGPISNPSDAETQVIGVFDQKLTHPLAQAMGNMGVKRGMVVSGENGMDELSNVCDTYVSELRDGMVRDYVLTPEQLGLPRRQMAEIEGKGAEENARVTLEILSGCPGAKREITVLNAGAALYCSGKAESIEQGIVLAQDSIDSGKAMEKLQALVQRSK